LTFVAFTLTFD
jgi:hypothetical protein